LTRNQNNVSEWSDMSTHSQYNGSIKVTHSKVTIYEINIAALYDLLICLIVVH
jgi:L,D-peptidoglycan transpeptidase YkuD (ErfK/YbiS/YcfS/YnhG family)